MAEVNLLASDIGHNHPSLEQFSDEGSSNKQHAGEPPTGEQPRDKDRSTAASIDDLRGESPSEWRLACVWSQKYVADSDEHLIGVVNGHASNCHRGNSADALSWWGLVTTTAELVTLGVARTWEKHRSLVGPISAGLLHTMVDSHPFFQGGAKGVGNHQEGSTEQR